MAPGKLATKTRPLIAHMDSGEDLVVIGMKVYEKISQPFHAELTLADCPTDSDQLLGQK